MIFYVLYDTRNNTYSLPMLAPDLPTVIEAIPQLKSPDSPFLMPHVICELEKESDVLLLSLDRKKNLPEFAQITKSGEVTPSPTQQPKGVSLLHEKIMSIMPKSWK